MKKILLALPLLALLATVGCNKTDDDVSQIVTVSYPTISFNGGAFYSINVGGSVPTIAATSYDSVLGESYPVTVTGQEDVDNTTPGLYIIQANAKNKYAYSQTENILIAVTDISDAEDVSGLYVRAATGGEVHVEKLARGLYSLDNLGGVGASSTSLFFPVYFVQTDDSTFILPVQETVQGTVSVKDANGIPNRITFNRTLSDTSYQFAITQPNTIFGGALRTFEKQ